MTGEYLFVYGTLRQAAGHPLHAELLRHARPVGLARYAGRLFDLGPYPAVIPEPGGVPTVLGELYRMHGAPALLALLDRYEGCTDERGRPLHPREADYRRERQRVIRADGTAVEAWMYLYNRPTLGHRLIAGGDYLAR